MEHARGERDPSHVLVGVGAALLILGGAALSLACRPGFIPYEDCYRGLGVGQVIEVELMEPHTRDGSFTYWDMSDPDGIPSCGGRDGLEPGVRLRFELVSPGVGSSDCRGYSAVRLDSLPGVSERPQPIGGAGRAAVLATQDRFDAPECPDTWWRFFVTRHNSLDDDPFDEVPVAGQLPPVVVRREINACGCLDRWVGVVRHVEPTDAGTDAGE